jgi:hypothetical protein
VLGAVKKILLDHPEIHHLLIEGHTNSRGSLPYNRNLSRRRASAVSTWLSSRGVDGDRILYKGYGEEYPLLPTGHPASMAMNRRVEFTVLRSDENGALVDDRAAGSSRKSKTSSRSGGGGSPRAPVVPVPSTAPVVPKAAPAANPWKVEMVSPVPEPPSSSEVVAPVEVERAKPPAALPPASMEGLEDKEELTEPDSDPGEDYFDLEDIDEPDVLDDFVPEAEMETSPAAPGGWAVELSPDVDSSPPDEEEEPGDRDEELPQEDEDPWLDFLDE